MKKTKLKISRFFFFFFFFKLKFLFFRSQKKFFFKNKILYNIKKSYFLWSKLLFSIIIYQDLVLVLKKKVLINFSRYFFSIAKKNVFRSQKIFLFFNKSLHNMKKSDSLWPKLSFYTIIYEGLSPHLVIKQFWKCVKKFSRYFFESREKNFFRSQNFFFIFD